FKSAKRPVNKPQSDSFFGYGPSRRDRTWPGPQETVHNESTAVRASAATTPRTLRPAGRPQRRQRHRRQRRQRTIVRLSIPNHGLEPVARVVIRKCRSAVVLDANALIVGHAVGLRQLRIQNPV